MNKNLKPVTEKDLQFFRNNVNLHSIVNITQNVKIKTSTIHKGRIAKKGHIFYLVTCEWNLKNHSKLREINRVDMSTEDIKQMEETLIKEMAESVLKYMSN